MKKLLASSMGSNEKVNSNKLFCTLKISKDLIEYVQKKIKFFVLYLSIPNGRFAFGTDLKFTKVFTKIDDKNMQRYA